MISRCPRSLRPVPFLDSSVCPTIRLCISQFHAVFGQSGCKRIAAPPVSVRHSPILDTAGSKAEEKDLETLLTVILIWLSTNFSLPETREHPRVEFVSAAKMSEVRYDRLAAVHAQRVAAEVGRVDPAELSSDVHAIYDDLSRAIYLLEGWTASSSTDVSVLVHELVHHVQNINGLQYTCMEEREKSAYKAQARWLELFGKTLADEFGLDPMTLLVRTNCMR